MSVRLGDKILAGISESDLRRSDVEDGTVIVAKAKDADTVDGYHASSFYNSVVSSQDVDTMTSDPNTTTLAKIRTLHANCPSSDIEYIIETTFTDGRAENSEKYQIAKPSNGMNYFYTRAKQYNRPWSTWERHATVVDLTNYLPVAGGVMKGMLFLGSGYGMLHADSSNAMLTTLNTANDTSVHRQILLSNSNLVADLDGCLRLLDRTSNTSHAEYPILHTGNMAKHVLPLTGGTLSGMLHLKNGIGSFDADVNHTEIISRNSSYDDQNLRGIFVSNSVHSPAIKHAAVLRDVINGELIDYFIFHTGNKPIGNYIGNEAPRTVEIPSFGNALLIFGSNAHNVIVTPHGALCFFGSTMASLGSDSIKFREGVLTVGSKEPTNAYFNAADVIYTYQVL